MVANSSTSTSTSTGASAITPAQQTGFPYGGNNPQNAALNAANARNEQASALSKVGGRRMRRRRYTIKGGAVASNAAPASGTIEVQSQKPMYNDPAGGGQSASDTSLKLASLQASSAEQSKFDAGAKQSGGTKQRGGVAKWSCYSGGKRSAKRNRKRTAKRTNRKRTHTKRRRN